MKPNKKLGKFLKERRQFMAFDFSDIAKMLSCTSAHVLAIENGEKRITVSMLHKLSNALQINKNDLLAFDESKDFKGTM